MNWARTPHLRAVMTCAQTVYALPPHLFFNFPSLFILLPNNTLFFSDLLWPGTHYITLSNSAISLLYSLIAGFIINSHMAILIFLFSIIVQYKLPNQLNPIYILSNLIYDSDSSLVQLRNVTISQFSPDFYNKLLFSLCV